MRFGTRLTSSGLVLLAFALSSPVFAAKGWREILGDLNFLCKMRVPLAPDLFSDDGELRAVPVRDEAIYGITVPPEGDVRLPGEFEPGVVEVLLVYGGAGAYDVFYRQLFDSLCGNVDLRVTVLEEDEYRLRQLLGSAGCNEENSELIHAVPTDTIWTTDFIQTGTLTRFDEGAIPKILYFDPEYYVGRENDDAFATLLADYDGREVTRPPLRLDGGNLLSNGQGLCFTTVSLVEGNADNELLGDYVESGQAITEDVISEVLRDYYGCTQTVFLKNLVGNLIPHIDMFFSLSDPHTLLLGEYDWQQDPANHAILETNYQLLEDALLAGEFEIVRVPMPDHGPAGQPGFRLPVLRTHLNLSIVNDLVLVPTFKSGGRIQDTAMAILEEAFPGRRVIGIDSDVIAPQYGAVHCTLRTVFAPIAP